MFPHLLVDLGTFIDNSYQDSLCWIDVWWESV
jgi:hypothetical protein